MTSAIREAELLGDAYVGPEHLLMALVAPGETSVAARALRESGVDYEALCSVDAKSRKAADRSRGKVDSRPFPPSMYVVKGRAEGFAAALGAKQLQAEHFLLALLWHTGRHTFLLDDLGVSRLTIQRKLAKLGAAVPRSQPPAPDDTKWGETFTIRLPQNDAWGLAHFVLPLIPEGAPFGFNFDATKAWFTTGQGIDLAALVRKGRRQQLRHLRRETKQP